MSPGPWSRPATGQAAGDVAGLDALVPHLWACAAACRSCAGVLADLDEGVAGAAAAAGLHLECASLCERTSAWLTGPAAGERNVARFLVEACALVCARCAEQDEASGPSPHGRCGDACRRCERACREAVAALR